MSDSEDGFHSGSATSTTRDDCSASDTESDSSGNAGFVDSDEDDIERVPVKRPPAKPTVAKSAGAPKAANTKAAPGARASGTISSAPSGAAVAAPTPPVARKSLATPRAELHAPSPAAVVQSAVMPTPKTVVALPVRRPLPADDCGDEETDEARLQAR